MKVLIIPAVMALIGGSAFAQARPAAGEDQATEKVATDGAATPQDASEPAAGRSEPSDAPEPIPPRTEEQAAVAREIARTAPERVSAKIPANPARDNTVMYELTSRKLSDVAIVASVDQVDKLALLDITGEDRIDTLRAPPSGFSGANANALAPGAEEGAGDSGESEGDAASAGASVDAGALEGEEGATEESDRPATEAPADASTDAPEEPASPSPQ